MLFNDEDDEYEQDWEINSQGLYVASRGFLSRRGYCCANECRNCPYINWRDQPDWQPVSPNAIQFATISPKAYEAASHRLTYHERMLQDGRESPPNIKADHQTLYNHYHLLLERWEPERG